MANMNHFKMLKQKSKKSFEQLKQYSEKANSITDDTMKARFGFYLLMLENITGIQDTADLIDMILDTDFNSKLFDDREDDNGIDAFYIETTDGDNCIHLFNFKYREKFNSDKKQSLNESLLGLKFINKIATENIKSLKGKIKNAADDILAAFHSDEVYKFKYHIISNENNILEIENTDELKNFKELYDLDVNPIGLNEISEVLLVRPKPVNATLLLEGSSVMSYREDNINSNVSYIIRLSLFDLLRITCKDSDFRSKTLVKDSDLKLISNQDIDIGVLFDNVRGFVTKSKFNYGINKTLETESKKFFLYNNGITIIAKDIIAEEVNAGKKYQIKLLDFQVINGGQTLRTLHNFNKLHPDNYNKLSEAEVLVRAFKFSNDNERNKIAEYTNSQNAISNIDLKSIRTEQIMLEDYLADNGILYSRKKGDLGENNKDYDFKISMEKFGQILFSLTNPHQASNKKKDIFGEFYDNIFNENNLEFEKAVEYIKKYFEIEREYRLYATNKKTKVSDQKYFYILYILYNFLNGDSAFIKESIEILEDIIGLFDKKDISDARKLIQVTFKNLLDEKIHNYLN